MNKIQNKRNTIVYIGNIVDNLAIYYIMLEQARKLELNYTLITETTNGSFKSLIKRVSRSLAFAYQGLNLLILHLCYLVEEVDGVSARLAAVVLMEHDS